MKCKPILWICLVPFLCFGQAVKEVQRTPDGIHTALPDGTLGIYPLSERAVRIKFFRPLQSPVPEFVVTQNNPVPEFQVADSPEKLEVKVKYLSAVLDKQTGNLSFLDHSGKPFLSEKAGSRKLIPNEALSEPCLTVEQSFLSPTREYLFGLGQFQDGHYNLRNVSRRLTQVNSQISLPFIYSSEGYGLLWHQYGLVDFNPADHSIALEKQVQVAHGGQSSAEVTTNSGTQKVLQDQLRYSGYFRVPEDGVYSIFLDLGDMDNRHFVVIDGKPCIDVSNYWLPPTTSALVDLKAGEHEVQSICKSSNTPRISWKLVDNLTTFRSPNAHMLDYIVFYGPSADSVVAAYRNMTGQVPMLPRWAYGFWQCRERYTSGAHLVETVKEFRKRDLPMDVIVQDWQYWGNQGWGVPQFDSVHYANPSGFIKDIHDMNAHLSISVWSNPDRNSVIGRMCAAHNLYVPESKWLDYFNPLTRETYWNTLNDYLFASGVDSWWMDATEPENDALKGAKTYYGLGDFYRLIYPLFASQAVYEGQRKTTGAKRVCILTRSAFLGQQKYGIINWSGDIGGTWDSYRRQIVAGLNFVLTGLPYWTTDIGGFFRPGKTQYTDKSYQELLTRWFQWGALNPIFRIHGYQTETEPWKYGPQVEEHLRRMLNLRYRLMPYIYSEAWQITRHGSTLMRPLVMDFTGDQSALRQRYEYLFGKALLVAPVTAPQVKEWQVYLPTSAVWYDFWTGRRYSGGQTIKVDAPLDRLPIFVRAGSIIPMGPFIEYAAQQNDPIEIRIFPGANGEFVLYEDENDNYNYEKGAFSTILFNWDDARNELTLHERQGSFPGMLAERRFNLVRVSRDKISGIDISKPGTTTLYNGKPLVVHF